MTEGPRSGDFDINRRRFLSSVGVLSTLPTVGADDQLISTTDEFDDRIQSTDPASPPFPEDPFMPGQFASRYLSPTDRKGWEEASIREEYRTLIGLHLDVFDSAGLAVLSDGELRPDQGTSRALSLSLRTGLATTAGRNTTIAMNREDGLQPILEEQGWEYPRGASLDSVSGAYAETVSGTDQIIEFSFTTNGIPSAFAPLGLHLMKVVATKRFDQGFSGFLIDKVFNRHGLDFSQWATAAFRDHIQSLSASRQNELGVEDPEIFDVKEYLRKNNLMPGSRKDPREDPVFQEYVLHNHLGIQSYLASLRSDLVEEFPDRFEQGDAAIWANQFTGILYGPQAVNVYGSAYFDVISTELFPTVNPATDYKYKLLQAVGDFEKPVLAKATLVDGLVDDPELDPAGEYPNLERFQLAESHGNGARLKIPLSPRGSYAAEDSINQWIRNNGEVPETLQSLADFVWTHKRFLTDTSPENTVAVVWSLPDRMYRRLPQWGIGDYDSHPEVDSFIGATKLLREAQIPYTVLVFGHPDLWDDTEQLERLSDHGAVVLPDIECLTDSQYSALSEYLGEDGFLISSGSPPERNSRYGPRNDVDELFSNENAVVLDENPALDREQNGQASSRFQETLADAGILSFADRQDPTLSVNVRRQSEPPRTVVHLLNYDYSKETDSFESKTNIRVRVPSPDHDVGAVRYYSEQETVDIEADTSGEAVTFTVPTLTDWGFVVLARSEADLVNTQARTAAEDAVGTLRENINSAREAGYDWSPSFTVAQTRVEEATTALETDAYSEALAAAEKATPLVQELNRQKPVIGIDLSHGQASSFQGENPFERLYANIAYPEYRIIESWSESSINDLDILIVPPALTFKGESYAFTQDEVDQITSFVENGGSLIVTARGKVAPDISQLVSEFGYSFDYRGINFPNNVRSVAPTVSNHELTRAVPQITADWGTPIVELPEQATVLASLPEDNEAWFHEEEPLDERNESEEDVPADPIYAVSDHSDGTVVVLGVRGYLHAPEGRRFWTPVINNLFLTLSSNGPDSTGGTTKTPAATSTDTPEDSGTEATQTSVGTQSEEATSSEAPGFGIFGGLAGITGAVALARRLRNSED